MRRLLNFRIILIFTIITNNLYSQNSFVDSLFNSKGEQYFSFNNSREINLNQISKLISIDHKTNDQTIFAYANKKQFLDFLKLEIDYQIIEDLAQSMGAKANDERIGLRGEIGICSFYATKMMTSGGQGGVVISRYKK